jgi:hypothetical protein
VIIEDTENKEDTTLNNYTLKGQVGHVDVEFMDKDEINELMQDDTMRKKLSKTETALVESDESKDGLEVQEYLLQ